MLVAHVDKLGEFDLCRAVDVLLGLPLAEWFTRGRDGSSLGYGRAAVG
jgi:hypothetical protein